MLESNTLVTTKKRMKQLLISEARLYALMSAGVSSWEGYQEALEHHFTPVADRDIEVEDLDGTTSTD